VFNDLTEAHTIVWCELSEGLAFKYFVIRHLNQAHRQYVDSNVLAFVPAATPLLFDINHTLMSVGCQGFWRNVRVACRRHTAETQRTQREEGFEGFFVSRD